MNRLQIRTRIRRAADMVGSSFVSDTELNEWIDTSTNDLYNHLVRTFGDEYYARIAWFDVGSSTSEEIVNNNLAMANVTNTFTDDGTSIQLVTNRLSPFGAPYTTFALPSTFRRLVRLSFVRGIVTQQYNEIPGEGGNVSTPSGQFEVETQDSEYRPIRRIDTAGQAMLTKPRDWYEYGVQYRLRHGPCRFLVGGQPVSGYIDTNGTLIDFTPTPPAGTRYAVQIMYVPTPRFLVNDGGEFPYEHEDYIINDVAAQCVEKQRADSSTLRAAQARAINSITQLEQTPDAANPPQVVMHGVSNRRALGGFVP